LIQRIESKDIAADELIVGGEIAATAEGAKLKDLGVSVHRGVKAAADEARQRIAKRGAEFVNLSSNGG
jgi:CRISPR-associated protein Cst2